MPWCTSKVGGLPEQLSMTCEIGNHSPCAHLHAAHRRAGWWWRWWVAAGSCKSPAPLFRYNPGCFTTWDPENHAFRKASGFHHTRDFRGTFFLAGASYHRDLLVHSHIDRWTRNQLQPIDGRGEQPKGSLWAIHGQQGMANCCTGHLLISHFQATKEASEESPERGSGVAAVHHNWTTQRHRSHTLRAMVMPVASRSRTRSLICRPGVDRCCFGCTSARNRNWAQPNQGPLAGEHIHLKLGRKEEKQSVHWKVVSETCVLFPKDSFCLDRYSPKSEQQTPQVGGSLLLALFPITCDEGWIWMNQVTSEAKQTGPSGNSTDQRVVPTRTAEGTRPTPTPCLLSLGPSNPGCAISGWFLATSKELVNII